MYLNLIVTWFEGLIFQYQYVVWVFFNYPSNVVFRHSSQMYRKTINLLSKTTLK